MPTHAMNTGQEWVPTNPVLGVSRGSIAVMENASVVPGTCLGLGQMFIFETLTKWCATKWH